MKNRLKHLLIEVLRKDFDKNELDKLVEVQQTTAKHIKADYFSNIAMKLAKQLHKSPVDIAEEIVKKIQPSDTLTFEVAKPGYINFTIKNSQKNNIVSEILESPDLLAPFKTKEPKKIHVEFVSATPTGPLHVGHGRGVIYGNIIAKFLKIQGHDVYTEYYVNNVGNQMNMLARSVLRSFADSTIKKLEDKMLPSTIADENDDLYKGEYVKDIAKKYKNIEEFKEDIKNNNKVLCELVIDNYIKKELDKLGVIFDNWFYESSLLDDHSVQKILTKLEKSGHAKQHEGALMLQADELRPLIKSDGDYTYFATDLAYHNYKLSNYDLVIDVWGADHHGYVPRMKCGLEALGHDIKKLDFHLIQFANLHRGKEKISMSTRKGDFVTLKTLIDEIGNDAINFFYLTKNKDQHLDFDLHVAVSEDKNNPVYYIQYAHARIGKILNKVENFEQSDYNPNSLNHNLEKNIISSLNGFNEACEESIIKLQPHVMTHYLQKLSQDFHSYYANVKLLTDKIDYNKIFLVAAVQKVLRCGLELLNINAPMEM